MDLEEGLIGAYYHTSSVYHSIVFLRYDVVPSGRRWLDNDTWSRSEAPKDSVLNGILSYETKDRTCQNP